ncbi:MAG: alkaline phosphatase family protein [Acidimicrobiales bacterium]
MPGDDQDPDTTANDTSPEGLSRRRLLGGAAAGGAALLVSSSQIGRAAAATTSTTASRLPRNPAASGIDHVIVVMMENRSFDHYLGWVPGADGPRAKQKYRDAAGVAHPIWHLDSFTGDGYHDPNHSQTGGVAELNGGACDGWLVAPNNDLYSIGYYRDTDLDFYRGAAPYWTVCDRFFASILGPTYPNRFYMHAAQTDRISNTTTTSTLPTIWDSLATAGVEGRYYYSDLPFIALWGSKYGPISHPFSEFLTDCSTGNLPAVSYVDPRFFTTSNGPQGDDHPHADIRFGQAFLNQIYEAVTAGPQWGNTLLVITYDEWGGFFDHVPPGVAPDAVPANGQRGFRIPTLLIGPRVRRRNVSHRTYDHTSILKLIEWRFGLPPLTPRDAAANNLAESLLFLREPNLEAPLWDVPTPTSLGTAAPSGTTTSLVGAASAASPPPTEHEAEWLALAALADQHGFAMP